MSYSAPTVWAIIVAMAVGTFALRISFLHWFGSRTISPEIRQALRFVPPAVLAALVLPALFYGGAEPGMQPARLAGGLITALLTWRLGGVILPMSAGMGVFLLLRGWLL